jgi:diaminopimelate epimerase
MCGNGARCAVAFSNFLGIIREKGQFLACDGPHTAKFFGGKVELGMSPVKNISTEGPDCFVNTGSPHHVRFVEDVKNYPVVETGAQIRYSDLYQPNGANVNFVTALSKDEIYVRTYERGVEDETLSCGTGVTACALVHGKFNGNERVIITTPGGKLGVSFKANPDGSYQDILLIGPAEQVFKGVIRI